MLKKLIFLSLTISSLTSLQAMDLGEKTRTQADAKQQYDEKATKDLQEFVENYDTLKETASSAELAQQFQDIIKRSPDVNAPIQTDGYRSFEKPLYGPISTSILYEAVSNSPNIAVIKLLLDANANPFEINSSERLTPRRFLEREIKNNQDLMIIIEQKFIVEEEHYTQGKRARYEEYKNKIQTLIPILELIKKAEQPPIAPPSPWPFPESNVTAGNTPQTAQTSSTSKE